MPAGKNGKTPTPSQRSLSTRAELSAGFALYSDLQREWSKEMKHQDMEVEVIYQQPDGSQVILGVRKLDGIPKIGKPFELDHRQYLTKSYSGPDATGRYRLFLEDEPEATRH
jgi:hypothetical protein